MGGVFLCYLGVRTFLAYPADLSTAIRASTHLRAYLSTVLLTLTNPMTILSFTAVFAGFGAGTGGRGYGATLQDMKAFRVEGQQLRLESDDGRGLIFAWER